MLWLLIKNKFNIMLNGFLKENLSKRRRKIIALIGGCIVFYFMFHWIYEILFILQHHYNDGIVLIQNSLILFVSGFFMFLLATGITTSIHYLFISTDLPLLMSSPLSGRTIFSYKLMESIIANSSFFIFLGVPMFISMGLVSQAQWYYYPLMFIIMILFLAFPVCLSFMIAMYVVRFIPAVRAKELLAGVLGVLSLGIWLFIQIFRASQLHPQSIDFHPGRIEQLRSMGQSTVMNYLPSTWAVKSLIGISIEDGSLFASQFIPLLFIVTAIFFISLSMAERNFKDGLMGTNIDVLKRKRKKSLTNVDDRHLFFAGRLPGTIMGAIFKRDVKLLMRDFRQLTNIFLLFAMIIIFPITRKTEIGDSPDSLFALFLPVLFIAAVASSQLTARLIPMEGRSYWMMMAAPQPWKKILISKFLVGFTLNFIALGVAITVFCFYFNTSMRITLLLFFIGATINFCLSVFGLVIGSMFPNFEWDHPKKMLSSGGGLILTIGSIVIAGICVGLMIFIYEVVADVYHSVLMIDLIVIFMGLLIITITAIIGIHISSKKMEALEWSL